MELAKNIFVGGVVGSLMVVGASVGIVGGSMVICGASLIGLWLAGG
ncbi:hypothetical protein [Bdellovibrio bacteriovorus]|uniref:Uncharacterized protein n=1 Tax=Bdellovibrio bacteriovorus (strain ATCC 15356 / DSM 50701 / NCIMB 9529 / HD100) TaxID=264462 RepID=Q6MK19_BDEBA|nr:hypothetical protein [Bdellovibrio bacteriovorus]BEV68982.1 hypothetical protein Bb109J_c2402 [Bdellovibrio bacteriovorus]CAE80390.1 hypothetical protein predicted by Glimmer/Critica [Bdellovibrio bacteriovorus HD100]